MNLSEREQLRKALLKFLSVRQAYSFDVSSLVYHIREQHLVTCAFDESDVSESLAFLEGLGLVESQQGQLGASLTYRASSQGVLLYERTFAH
jgi:hypothetical protein